MKDYAKEKSPMCLNGQNFLFMCRKALDDVYPTFQKRRRSQKQRSARSEVWISMFPEHVQANNTKCVMLMLLGMEFVHSEDTENALDIDIIRIELLAGCTLHCCSFVPTAKVQSTLLSTYTFCNIHVQDQCRKSHTPEIRLSSYRKANGQHARLK